MADNVNFNTIPIKILTGGAYIEIDNSKAVRGLPQMERKLLLIGQRLPAGKTPALTPMRILSAADAEQQHGRGSMLHLMAKAVDAAKAQYGLIDAYGIGLEDLTAGKAAAGTIAITGTVTRSGTLTCYVAGVQVKSAATVGNTATDVASKMAATINAVTDLPVTAEAATGTVTLTARNKGEAANGMEVSAQYYDDDLVPDGLIITCTNLSGGTGNPDVANALASISDDWFYSIACPYTDSANLAAIEADMDGRWGGMNMKTGHIFTARAGSHADLTSFGDGRNSPHVSCWGLRGSPTWDAVRAAAFAAVCEFNGAIDPALPLRNLTVPGVLAPRLKDRFSRDERELLLRSGISSTTTDVGGKIFLERVVTNYRRSPQGIADESLMRLETKWTVDYFRYVVRVRILLRFPRHKLADDGINIAPGQKLVTPAMIRDELIAVCRELENVGIVENVDQFKKELIVVRSVADPDRVNAVMPPDIVNQFVTFAAAVQYYL